MPPVPGKGTNMTRSADHPAPAIDPECGRSVGLTAARFTAGTGDSVTYFCSENRLHRFTESGNKTPSAPKKGFWARYLDRLNKATGGKPPQCCG